MACLCCSKVLSGQTVILHILHMFNLEEQEGGCAPMKAFPCLVRSVATARLCMNEHQHQQQLCTPKPGRPSLPWTLTQGRKHQHIPFPQR